MTVRAARQQPAVRDHGFHPLAVREVVRETAEASTFVLDVPAEFRDAFRYDAGQFCTFRVAVEGVTLLRCYSMSSAPQVDALLQVTVKRVPGGRVSNWLLDHLGPGDVLDATCPGGVFTLEPSSVRPLVACCAGSGITPVLSLLKQALATTDRPLHLLYANREAASVIFATQLDALAAEHPGRLQVEHHFDVDGGFIEAATVDALLARSGPADLYVCGPTPFMDLVERAAAARGLDAGDLYIERFTPGDVDIPVEAAPSEDAGTQVTIELDGQTASTSHRPGTTVLQTARQLGMAPPFSCEAGSCATCMARLLEGEVSMFVNNALTDDEVRDGWILTCQAVPTTPTVHVAYGFEET